ncbi:hypothetical protein ACP4OV_016031 [Aristida adscensionis]
MEVEHGHGAPRPRVILRCSPCMGHLIPFVELARRLVAGHGLAATLLFAAATPALSQEYLAVAATVPAGVDLVALPAPPEDALPPSASVLDRVALAVASAVPRAAQAARSLAAAAPVAAVVIDAMSAAARCVAEELGVPFYMFFTSPWTMLSLLLRLPELDAALAGEHRDAAPAAEPIRLPGCAPIASPDLPTPMLAGRSSRAYAMFLHAANEYRKVDGRLPREHVPGAQAGDRRRRWRTWSEPSRPRRWAIGVDTTGHGGKRPRSRVSEVAGPAATWIRGVCVVWERRHAYVAANG